MSEDFLSRWSRRKYEARRATHGSTSEPERAVELAPGALRQCATDRGMLDTQPALTQEEVVTLPKVDELRADSDITSFLRSGVPEGLRNAALRKMWMLDPAIRDFAGHARDYAYDWNTPGGVPGKSALEPEYVATMVRRVFGESETVPCGQAGREPAEDHAPAVRLTEDGFATAVQKGTLRGGGNPVAHESEAEAGASSGKGETAANADT